MIAILMLRLFREKKLKLGLRIGVRGFGGMKKKEKRGHFLTFPGSQVMVMNLAGLRFGE